VIALLPKSVARGGKEKPSPLFDRQPVPDAQTQPPDTLDAPDASREFRTEEPRIGGLVRNATHRGETEVDGGRRVRALFEVDAVPQHDGTIEREPWLRAVPADELVDRVAVRPLTAGRREAV